MRFSAKGYKDCLNYFVDPRFRESLSIAIGLISRPMERKHGVHSTVRQIPGDLEFTQPQCIRLGQFSIDPKSGLNHQDEEERDVGTIATLCIVLLASKFLATQKCAVERKQVEALATAYANES